MKKLFILMAVGVMLTGCLSSGPENFEAMLDRLEFDEDESGCVRLQGDVNIGTNPLLGSSASLTYYKRKAGEDEAVAPVC